MALHVGLGSYDLRFFSGRNPQPQQHSLSALGNVLPPSQDLSNLRWKPREPVPDQLWIMVLSYLRL